MPVFAITAAELIIGAILAVIGVGAIELASHTLEKATTAPVAAGTSFVSTIGKSLLNPTVIVGVLVAIYLIKRKG